MDGCLLRMWVTMTAVLVNTNGRTVAWPTTKGAFITRLGAGISSKQALCAGSGSQNFQPFLKSGVMEHPRPLTQLLHNA